LRIGYDSYPILITFLIISTMPATLRPVGHLQSYLKGQAELVVPAGLSIRETLRSAGIPPELVALVVVNGVHQTDKDMILQDGDVVRIMAVIGGG
jgi:sulfur carrier protein ThiS